MSKGKVEVMQQQQQNKGTWSERLWFGDWQVAWVAGVISNVPEGLRV
jgi:hypothetical protein